MANTKDNMSLDTRLLCEAIIELNISRHNVSVYPKGHPLVEQSLQKAFDFLTKLFELRLEVTLAIAGDTIIFDEYPLNRENPIYREFALCLNQKGIASITLYSKLSKEELYSFHTFLLSEDKDCTPEEVHARHEAFQVPHISIEFIDYSAFSLAEGKTDDNSRSVSLWEEYIFGLMNGSLQKQNTAEVIQEIPPDKLAEIINKSSTDMLSKEGHDRIISSYIKTSPEKIFSSKDLGKLLEVINELHPDLKQQFLASTIDFISSELDSIQQAMNNLSTQEVIDFLSIINEQRVAIPEALKNILQKFSKLNHENIQAAKCGNNLIEDDFFLSEEVTNLLSDANFSSFVSDSYRQEIQRLVKYDTDNSVHELIKEHEKELHEEYIDKVFHQTVLELISHEGSDMIDQKECDFYINMLKEQMGHFIETGQYKQVLQTFSALESNLENKNLNNLASEAVLYFNSPTFIAQAIESIRMMGREMKEDVFLLCEYYERKIIPQLIDTLITEESPTIRRFLISLITNFGDTAAPDILARLDDSRWFVRRNMLFMLIECGSSDSLRKVKKLCDDEHPKVSLEAIKCLLKAGDDDAVQPLRNHLTSKLKDNAVKAINLAGMFQVNDVVSDLLQMLKKKNLSGVDIEDKIPVVRALGKIKDPGTVNVLKSILSSRTFLFSSSRTKLKEEVRIALNNFTDNKPGVSD